jgi:hypothetical protein
MIDMPAYKCRSDVCKRWRSTLLRPGRRAAIASLRHRGNSERRETAFQFDGTVLSTLSGIELGFDSSVDLNGESSLWKFVRTRSHAEVQNFAL